MIQLISKDEKLVFNYGESKIYYRRVPTLERQLAIQRSTSRGITNWSAVGLDLCRRHVIGWEGFTLDGAEVKYDGKYLEVLPDDVLTELYSALGAANVEGKEAPDFLPDK